MICTGVTERAEGPRMVLIKCQVCKRAAEITCDRPPILQHGAAVGVLYDSALQGCCTVGADAAATVLHGVFRDADAESLAMK